MLFPNPPRNPAGTIYVGFKDAYLIDKEHTLIHLAHTYGRLKESEANEFHVVPVLSMGEASVLYSMRNCTGDGKA